MSGIPNNEHLQRFREIQTDQQVSLKKDGNTLDRQETGKLGEKIVRWITGKGETENTRATKAFFDSLEEVYGKHVKDWAIRGYEDRLTDGKPLSGYRIQQILERAQTARDNDVERLKTLLDERTPALLDEALAKSRLGIPDPEGTGKKFHGALLALVKDAIRQSEAFKDPGKLESRSFSEEFQGIVDEVVRKHHHAISHVTGFNNKCQELPGRIDNGEWPKDDGFDWGGIPTDKLKELTLPSRFGGYTEQLRFLEEFGEGQSLDTYFLSRAKSKFEDTLGKNEPEKLGTYDKLMESSRTETPGHNGTYSVEKKSGSSFGHVFRMDKGISPRTDFLDDKFHVSVHPKDIGKAYEAIAPILLKHDCPIDYWKVSDGDKAKSLLEESRQNLRDLDEGHDRFSHLSTDQRQNLRKNYEENIQDSKRLHDECQFTLYLMPGQTGEQFNDMLREIEQALSTAGVRPNEVPGSDVPVGQFVTFRTGSMTYGKEHPNYDQLLPKGTVLDDIGTIRVRLDPFSPDYGSHKAGFGNTPFYRAQTGITLEVYGQEVARQSERLDKITDQIGTRDFLKLVAQTHQLARTVDGIPIPENDKNHLTGSCQDMKDRVTNGILQRLDIDNEDLPEALTNLMELVPEIGTLALQFEGREDDPGMLQRLQRGLREFEEVKRQVGTLEGLPEQTSVYLEAIESELLDMLAGCHDAQGASDNVRAVSDLTHGVIEGVPPGRSMLETIERVNNSTFGDDVKAEIEEILRLAGQIIAKSSDRELPMSDRLRMSGELESLRMAFGGVLTRQNENVDGPGQELIHALRELRFDMDTGVVSTFVGGGNQPVPQPLVRAFEAALKEVGIALETSDRGLQLDQDDLEKLPGHIQTLQRFVVDYRGPSSDGLRDELTRLQGYIDEARARET